MSQKCMKKNDPEKREHGIKILIVEMPLQKTELSEHFVCSYKTVLPNYLNV